MMSLQDISSFSISSLSLLFGNRTISSDDATYSYAEFTIGPEGLPTDWGFGAELNIEGGVNPEQIATHAGTTSTIFGQSVSFDRDIFFIDDPAQNNPQAFATGGGGGSDSDIGRGVWTLVPEPCTSSLCSLVLFAICSRQRP